MAQRGGAGEVRVTIRFTRTGRTADVQDATVHVVEAIPLLGLIDPPVLATTLPVDTTAHARAVVRLDAQRWCSNVAFEPMHAWGQDAFMVRGWVAIDRLSGWSPWPTPAWSWPSSSRHYGPSACKQRRCSASAPPSDAA